MRQKDMAGIRGCKGHRPAPMMLDQQVAEVTNKTISLRKWNWPLTKWYNGFSPQERVRGWQVSHWLLATGQLIDPTQNACHCSICGLLKNVSYHNENYYTPWTAKLVCKSCHYLLHTRFRNGNALATLRKRAARRTEAAWVLALSNQKNRHGGQTASREGGRHPGLSKSHNVIQSISI